MLQSYWNSALSSPASTVADHNAENVCSIFPVMSEFSQYYSPEVVERGLANAGKLFKVRSWLVSDEL